MVPKFGIRWAAGWGTGSRLGAAAVLAAMSLSCAAPRAPRPDPLDEALSAVAQWNHGDDRAPVIRAVEVLNRVRSGAARSAAEAALTRLATDRGSTRAGREFAIQQLGRLGGARSASELVRLLSDPLVADDADMALQRMGGGRRTDKILSAALAASPQESRARLARILGLRRAASAVPALSELARSGAPEAAGHAVRALGAIATAEAAEALLASLPAVRQAGREGGWEALLNCIEAAARRGDGGRKDQLIAALGALHPPDTVRAAVLLSVAKSHREGHGALRAATLLASTNAAFQVAGVELLRRDVGDAALAAIAGALPFLPPASQIHLLGLVEDRRFRPAVSVIELLAAKGTDSAVRAAALHTLGSAGTADSVNVLVAASSEGPDETRAAARRALRSLSGPGVDEALLMVLQQTSGPSQVELLRAVGDRAMTAAFPTVLRLAGSTNATVRMEAIRQLGALAGQSDADALLDGLMSSNTDEERQA